MKADLKMFFALFFIFIVGVAWAFAQFYWLGISIRWFPILFQFPHGASPVEMRFLALLSNLLVELVPSWIAALLLSLIRPKRWLLYSVVFIVPEVISTVEIFLQYGFSTSPHIVSPGLWWFALEECLRLVQVPILLLIISRLGNWWHQRKADPMQLRELRT